MSKSRTPSEIALQAKAAAHRKWATHDPVEGTAAARAAFDSKFDAMVDPSVTDPAERARRADQFRKAYFAELAYKSARARSRTPQDAA